MGKNTGLTVWTVRSTKRGADYYGACDQCGKVCSEHFVATSNKVFVRDNGQHYLSNIGGGSYGHLDCLIKNFGDLISEESLPRDGNIKLFPQFAVEKLLKNKQTTSATPPVAE